jgi:ribosomal protein S17E
LGGINGSSYRDFEGDISEVIILPYVPSESVRQRIEGYLAHKWGFTSKLPMDHPYKNLAP